MNYCAKLGNEISLKKKAISSNNSATRDQLNMLEIRQITQLNSQRNAMFLTTWMPAKAIRAIHGKLSTSWLRVKRPSHGKLKLANSRWQTQVGVCERHKNSRQTRFYLTPTVCKRVCRLFLCRSHTPTWVCQHEFASLPCEGRFREIQFLYGGRHLPSFSAIISGLFYLPA